MRLYNIQELKERRQELRKNQTPAEELLWNELRRNKLGVKFRRQHSIGGYILDFYCVKKKLIIEVDGAVHDFKKADDEVRDKYFRDLGYKILRIKNAEIEDNFPEVIKRITRS